MIESDEQIIKITSFKKDSYAQYESQNIAGPDLYLDDQLIASDIRNRFNGFDHSMTVAKSVVGGKRGKTAQFAAKGIMPFGSGVSFSENHRYSNNICKISTDVTIPKNTTLQSDFEIGSMTLGNFDEFAVLFSMSDTPNFSQLEKYESDQLPLVILLRNKNHTIEIGLGNDLWRWQNGFVGKNNQCYLSLSKDGEEVKLKRVVSKIESDFKPIIRSYRFSWYIAWSKNNQKSFEPWNPINVTYRDFDIDSTALKNELNHEPDSTIVLDIYKLPLPESIHHDTSGASHSGEEALLNICADYF